MNAMLTPSALIPERWLEKLERHVLSEIEVQVGALLRLAKLVSFQKNCEADP